MPTKASLPWIGSPYEDMYRQMNRYFPENPMFLDLEILEDYPVVDEPTLMHHYMRGGAAPFVDFLVYIDVGVGFKVNPVDFPDEETGKKAKKLVDEVFKKIGMHQTMMQFATYYNVLGRACIVKTYDLNGDFYFSEQEKCTGFDVINPMSLDMTALKRVMDDTTGTVPYEQNVTPNFRGGKTAETLKFDQDRVIYRVRDPMSRWAVMGQSILTPAITDLRTLARFPRYRSQMARKFANIHRHFKVLTETLAEDTTYDVLGNTKDMQIFMDDIHEMIYEQEQRSCDIVTPDFIESNEVTYAGREPDMASLERTTLESLALKFGIPLGLMAYSGDILNRATLDTLTDTFVNRREAGPRNHIFTPILEDTANEIIRKAGYMQGRMEIEYNPFLSKDMDAATNRAVSLVNARIQGPTEARRDLDMPDEVDTGGEKSAEKVLAQTQPTLNERFQPVTAKVEQEQAQFDMHDALMNGTGVKLVPVFVDE